MSLDVYLINSLEEKLSEWKEKKQASLKEAGSMIGLIPIIKQYYDDRIPAEQEELYWANITHNLSAMADQCGIYKHLWRPEEIDIKKASQLIEPLKEAVIKLKENPDQYKLLNPKNKWGSYEGFLLFVEAYLKACIDFPNASVRTTR